MADTLEDDHTDTQHSDMTLPINSSSEEKT